MQLDRVIAVRNSKTVYRDGGKCIKVFNGSYTKSDVLNEALNQARAEDVGLNVPKVLEVSCFNGKWAIVSEYIKGKTIAQHISDDPRRKDELLMLFVSLHSEMHKKSAYSLNRLKNKLNDKISLSELNATIRFDLHNKISSFPDEYMLCHGDFNTSNVIIRDDGVPFIIDWSHITSGSPAADVAETFLLFKMKGDFEGAEKYLSLYCEKTDISRETVEKWIPVVASAMSVTVKETERKFLLSCVF